MWEGKLEKIVEKRESSFTNTHEKDENLSSKAIKTKQMA